MTLQSLTELGGGCLGKVVDTRSDGTLVGEETRDSALVFRSSSTDEGRVVQKAVFGGVALGLQGTEESLLGTKNLNSGGGVLGKVVQAACVGDKASSDNLTNQSGKIGCHNAHLSHQIGEERLAVFGELDDTLGERDNILHVSLGDVLTHTVLGGINDVLSNSLIVFNVSSNVVQVFVGQLLFVFDEQGELGVALVIGDNLNELREMPRVPLANSHGEGINSLVKLVKNRNGLNNVVVVTLHRELHLGTRVSVTKTELGSINIAFAQLLKELASMETDATEKVLDDWASVTRLALHE